MAYKLNPRNQPSAVNSAALAVRGRDNGGPPPPLAASLAQYIRSANVEQLARLSRTAVHEASSGRVVGRNAASLLILAAEAARSIGYLSSAEAWLAQADAQLPAFASDLLFHLRSEQIRLLLDKNNLRAALTLAARVDCTVIERGLEKPLVEREEGAITADTLLLQAEVALVAGAIQQAQKLMDEAARRMSQETSVNKPRALSAVLGDRNDCLRLLQGIIFCRVGEPGHGLQLLGALQERLEYDEGSSRVLLARCRAASGDWVEVDAQPPAGINVLEARRWAEMARPVAAGTHIADDLFDVAIEQPETASTALAPVNELPPASMVFVPPQQLDAYADHLRTAVTQVAAELSERFTEQLTRVVAQVNERPRSDGYIYGGKFPHIDLASVIVQAEMQRDTGYVRVSWSPATVETTIIAGRLSPLARCGIGYVYLLDGNIIDATLCTEAPPPAESASKQDALSALVALLQVGIGIGLDHKPEGEALCYPDERVRTRHARIQIPPGTSQNLMQSLIVERETQLFGTRPPDILGEWEK